MKFNFNTEEESDSFEDFLINQGVEFYEGGCDWTRDKFCNKLYNYYIDIDYSKLETFVILSIEFHIEKLYLQGHD